MQARVFMFIIALLGVFWSGMLVAGRAGAQAVPVLSIEQQLANQRALINQLQVRLSALEGRGGVGSAKPAGTPVAPPRVVRLKSSVGDMTPGLTQLQMRHAQFAQQGGATAAPGPDVASQVANLTKEVVALKSQLSADETLIFGELELVRNNVNAVDNDTSTTYTDAVQAAWLACVDYGHQAGFAGWTPLYGNPPAPCFAAGY